MLVFGGFALRIRNGGDFGRHVELFRRRRSVGDVAFLGVGLGGRVEIVEIGLETEGVESGGVGLRVQNVIDFGLHAKL